MQDVMGAGSARGWTGRLASRIDRRATWGSIVARPEPYGIVRYRLTVYPPGTDPATRRWLRAWEAWLGSGLPVCTIAAMLLMFAVQPAIAIACSAGVYVAGCIIIGRRTRVVRRGVARLHGIDFGGRSTAMERADCIRIQNAAWILLDADRSLRAGLISPVAHELLWLQVYDAIEGAPTPGRSHV